MNKKILLVKGIRKINQREGKIQERAAKCLNPIKKKKKKIEEQKLVIFLHQLLEESGSESEQMENKVQKNG